MTDLSAITWNLFHGRDAPPGAPKSSLGSRMSGRAMRGSTHLQVTGDLASEFQTMIAHANWEICLLQECPPRWIETLVSTTGGAGSVAAKTSRNWFGPVSGRLAAHRPDLVGSWEGGSNLILSRGEAGRVVEREIHTLTRRPERRSLALALLGSGLVVGCLHLSTGRERALEEAAKAIDLSLGWARDRPLLLGGDWNLKPDRTFQRLVEEAGLSGLTPGGIDHLLVAGAGASAPRRWPEREREIQIQPEGLAVRLSDHAPVSREIQLT